LVVKGGVARRLFVFYIYSLNQIRSQSVYRISLKHKTHQNMSTKLGSNMSAELGSIAGKLYALTQSAVQLHDEETAREAAVTNQVLGWCACGMLLNDKNPAGVANGTLHRG